MKPEKNTPTPPAAPAATPPPAFDRATAKRVPGRRHEATAKTVAYEQPGDSGVNLFSVTRVFVATETPAETAARTKAEADAKAAAEADSKAAAAKPSDTPPSA